MLQLTGNIQNVEFIFEFSAFDVLRLRNGVGDDHGLERI